MHNDPHNLTDEELCKRLLELASLSRSTAKNRAKLVILQKQIDEWKCSRNLELAATAALDSLADMKVDILWMPSSPKIFDTKRVLGPPKIIEQCVWLLLPRTVRKAVLGDAEEAYWQTIHRYGSRRAATWDYGKEALFAVLFAIWTPVTKLFSVLKRSS